MTRTQIWLASLAATVVAVAIAYFWIDRPVSFWAHAHTVPYRYVFGEMPKISEWLFRIAAVVFVLAGAAVLTGRRLSHWQGVILLTSASLAASETIKDELKFVFGRTWPETWTNNNPSLINNGVFGFNPFQSGSWYTSFPSGHTAAVCSVMSVLWLCYPKFRPLYAIVVALVVGGLIGANYHFISDIIAGGFVGVSTGTCAVLLWRSYSAPDVVAPAAIAAPPLPPVAAGRLEKRKTKKRRPAGGR